MSFKSIWTITILAILLSGCATRGPAVLSQCLADDAVIAAYHDFQTENHGSFIRDGRAYLTGGYNEQTGVVSCYWQVHSLSSDILSPLSNPISVCNSAGNRNCAILMDGTREVFQPTSRLTRAANTAAQGQEVQAANSTNFSVVYHLVGAFAEGVARGLAENYSNRPARATYQSVQPERPLRCTADPMQGPFGQGYTCRR